MSFSDGSLIPDVGVGSAALHLPSRTLSPTSLGDPTHHTVYEAELVGIQMAAELAFDHRTRRQTSYWFFIDNQPSIRAFTQPLRASPGLALRIEAIRAFKKLVALSPTTSVSLVWCPAHVGITKNEEVDQAAKDSTTSDCRSHLPISLAAAKQQINSVCRTSVVEHPAQPILRRLCGIHDPIRTRKALMNLPRHSATAIAQLRAGHTPLLASLHSINAVDDPNCPECSQPETTEHFLMLCRKFIPQRRIMFEDLKQLDLQRRTQTILTNPEACGALANYIVATDRFAQARKWRPPPTQP